MADRISRHPERPPTHPGEVLREDVLPAPQLGQQTREVLAELGLDDREIDALEGKRVIVAGGRPAAAE